MKTNVTSTLDSTDGTHAVGLHIGWAQYAAPHHFYRLAGKAIPWFFLAAALIGGIGLYLALRHASADPGVHDVYRIEIVHVPAVWASVFIYAWLAFWAGAGLVWKARLPAMMASSLAPTGAMFTFVALWTGSLWVKPTAGAWWVWDARLACELALLLLYFGIMSLHAALDDDRRADRAGALLALCGIAVLPIIYFGTQLWNAAQPAPLGVPNAGMDRTTHPYAGVMLMALAFWMYSCATALMRVRCVILERGRLLDWVARAAARRA
jgi:heme exporter protein C